MKQSEEPNNEVRTEAPEATNPTPTVEATTQPPVLQAIPVQGPVQYVNIVNQKSLEGLGGWLMFWLVVFALNGLTFITIFFSLLSQPDQFKDPFGVATLIFAPLLIAGYVGSAVLIAMRKKLGALTSMATFGVAAVWLSIMMIISASKSGSPASEMVPVTIGLILTILVSNGLFALYFKVSKRVKATLVNS